MVDACLRTGVHYWTSPARSASSKRCACYDEAKQAGVMLLPGVGFDVVPTDCLAAHLHRRLPTATHLVLAFQSTGSVSRGTATTAVEQMGKGGGGMIRRDEQLVSIPTGSLTRTVDFGNGPRATMAIPWGDVSTAFHSTGIPNIRSVWRCRPSSSAWPSWAVGPGRCSVLAPRPSALEAADRGRRARSQRREAGPGQGASLGKRPGTPPGHRVESRMQTPEGYTLLRGRRC
ncbi:MAG: hypothetical protein R2854_19330 [Caldilineaceae bacterium]